MQIKALLWNPFILAVWGPERRQKGSLKQKQQSSTHQAGPQPSPANSYELRSSILGQGPDKPSKCPGLSWFSLWASRGRNTNCLDEEQQKISWHCHSCLQQEKQDPVDCISPAYQCGSYLGGVFGLPPQPSSGEVQSRAIRPLLPRQPSLIAGEQTEVLLPLQMVQNTSIRVPKTSFSLVSIKPTSSVARLAGKGLEPPSKRVP